MADRSPVSTQCSTATGIAASCLPAQYIVIEGLEGAGKTTARDTIAAVLRKAGISDLLFTREPGGTPLAEKIRELILSTASSKGDPLCDISELLLFYAARAQLVENVIKPALARGTWVIGDRHDLSTQAYQGGGRGIDGQLLRTLRQAALGEFAPHLTLYLDIDPQSGLHRARSRGQLDRIEQETLAFFRRTRARYQQLVAADPRAFTINAMQPLAQVQQAIRQHIQQWLQAGCADHSAGNQINNNINNNTNNNLSDNINNSNSNNQPDPPAGSHP